MRRQTPDEPPSMSRQVVDSARFYLGSTSSTGDELEVICGGWERTAADYLIRRDTYPWLAVEFVADGRGTVELDGRSHELGRGSLFTYGPGVQVRMESHSRELLSKYFINFVGREAVNLLSAAMLLPGSFRLLAHADEIEEVLRLMVADGRRTRPHSSAIATLQLRLLLLKLGGDSAPATDSDRRAQQTLRRCLQHIDQHLVESTTAEAIASACHVSPAHMSRLFRRFGHGSPYDYLTRKRMIHAAELLDSGYLLVREVADRLGMDAFHFSRVFKRVHGLSPMQFMRRHGDVQGAHAP